MDYVFILAVKALGGITVGLFFLWLISLCIEEIKEIWVYDNVVYTSYIEVFLRTAILLLLITIIGFGGIKVILLIAHL